MLNYMKYPRLVQTSAHTYERAAFVVMDMGQIAARRPTYSAVVYTKQRKKVDHGPIRA